MKGRECCLASILLWCIYAVAIKFIPWSSKSMHSHALNFKHWLKRKLHIIQKILRKRNSWRQFDWIYMTVTKNGKSLIKLYSVARPTLLWIKWRVELLNPVLFMSLFGHALFNYNPPKRSREVWWFFELMGITLEHMKRTGLTYNFYSIIKRVFTNIYLIEGVD